MIPARVSAGVVSVGEIEPREPDDASDSNAFASPKSRIFTLPSGVTWRLAGFRSRWTTPLS